MEDLTVPPEVVSERFERLRVVVEHSALQSNFRRIGRTEEVLVEGPSRKDPSVVSGRTRQNKMLHFPFTGRLRPGTLANVRVTEAAPHHMTGELVEILAQPPRRTRIPVEAV